MPPRAAAGRRADDGAPITGERYEVARGDTLATIARRARPADATIEQTAAAIYRANPEAFAGTPDVLLAGAALRLPDAAAIAAVDAAQARRELRLYVQDFRSYRDRIAAAPRQVEPAQAGQGAAGRIEAGIDESAAAAPPRDRLQLSRGADARTDGPAGAAGSQPSRLAGGEQRAARDAALAEVDARVRQIERTMADLRRLLEMKDQSLAAMQKQLDEARAAAGQPIAGPIARGGPAAGASTSGAGASQPVAAVPGGALPAAVAPVAAASAVAAPAAAAQPTAAAQAAAAQAAAARLATPTTAQPASGAMAATDAPATGAEPATPTNGADLAAPAAGAAALGAAPDAAAGVPVGQPDGTAPAPSVLDAAPAAPAGAAGTAAADSGGLLPDDGLLPALGGLALLGAGWAWLRVRRRRAAQADDGLLLPQGLAAGPAADAATPAEPQPLADERSASPRAPAQEPVPEVDPIAEAEVYIAYGREQQAEQILREALQRQPERQPVRLKLMEIYAERKDVVAFGGLAGEMYAATLGGNPEWPHVAALGRSIDPDNPVYAVDDEGAAPLSAPPAVPFGTAAPWAAASVPPAPADPALPPGAPAPGQAASEPQQPSVHVHGQADEEIAPLDFELDLDAALGRAGVRPAAHPGENDAAAQPGQAAPRGGDLLQAIGGRFELPSLDLDARPAEAPAAVPAAAPTGTSAALPQAASAPAWLALDPAPGSFAAPLAPDSQVLPGAGAAGASRAEPMRAPAAAAGGSGAFDLSGIGLELEPIAQPADQAPAEPAGAGSARWQEMATKLDLAAAYEEIGDREGARELLEEVLREGDAAQQQHARSMLARAA